MSLSVGGQRVPVRRRFGASVVALVAFMVWAVVGAMPAAAHGGPYELSVGSDAAGGVIVSADYVQDGHRVEEIMDPVVTAESSTGDTVGPIALISSSQGQGLWVSPEPFLDPGTWTVTVVTTTPDEAETTVTMEVEELEEAPSAEPSVAPSAIVGDAVVSDTQQNSDATPSATASTSDSATDYETGSESGVWWLIAAVVAAVVGIAALWLYRRKGVATQE
ncbi:LPXTG cell wall anchor domain-containing protein [Demequina sediminicola]|uniref:LPXTG cell wall anchor domain-containing protein n=1 Tax=Demequina sediminicola TaxID=1095026 RepID=UPI000784C539|nr:LPXTG cell wall anchor domain-containing protein [Demequina sediminicola]